MKPINKFTMTMDSRSANEGFARLVASGFAAQLDPTNAQYRKAYENINSDRSGGYRTERKAEDKSGCSACNICQALLCADCCCECMGGDLIRCC